MHLIFHRRHAMRDLLTEAEKCSTNRILYLRGALLTDKLHGSANWPTQILPSVGMVNRLTMLGVVTEADKMLANPFLAHCGIWLAKKPAVGKCFWKQTYRSAKPNSCLLRDQVVETAAQMKLPWRLSSFHETCVDEVSFDMRFVPSFVIFCIAINTAVGWWW